MYDPLFSYPEQYLVKDKEEKCEWLLANHTVNFASHVQQYSTPVLHKQQEYANVCLRVGQFAQPQSSKNIHYYMQQNTTQSGGCGHVFG